jgi:hypothetical protein
VRGYCQAAGACRCGWERQAPRVFGYAANQTTHLVGPNGAPNYTVAYAGTGQSEMVSKGQDAYTYNAMGMSSLSNGYGTFYYVREPDGNLIGQRVTGGRTYYYLGRSRLGNGRDRL